MCYAPTGTQNAYKVIFDSGTLTVPASSNPAGEVETFPVPDIAVQTGDVIGFYGQGIPLHTSGADILSFPAPTPPLTDATITLGDPGYPIYPQTRTYSFAASVVDLSGNNNILVGGIRKFVDGLPGLNAAGANNLGQYIPVAIPDTTTYPGSDYYEIAVVQYREKMHSDLPATLLRGYVQLSTPVVPGARVALTNAKVDGSVAPIVDAQGSPVLAVAPAHQLGPLVTAIKDWPVRIRFRNLLPTGVDGDLFLPVDTTVMGSGMGPAMGGMDEPAPQNPMCGNTPKPAGCHESAEYIIRSPVSQAGVLMWASRGNPSKNAARLLAQQGVHLDGSVNSLNCVTRRQFAVDERVGHLEEGGFLG